MFISYLCINKNKTIFTMNKHIVVGFEIPIGDNVPNYHSMSDRQKHECALNDETAVIYDNPKTFFEELNSDYVDTENKFWFLIKID